MQALLDENPAWNALKEQGVATGAAEVTATQLRRVGEGGGGAAGYEYALTTGGPVLHASAP